MLDLLKSTEAADVAAVVLTARHMISVINNGKEKASSEIRRRLFYISLDACNIWNSKEATSLRKMASLGRISKSL